MQKVAVSNRDVEKCDVKGSESTASIWVDGLNVYRGDRHILKDVGFTARRGEVLGLIGANGSGKSTLLKTILRLLNRKSGSIRIEGVDLDALDRKQLAKTVAYMAQENECRWPLSVRRVVALGRMPHQKPWKALEERDWSIVDQVMKTVAIEHLTDRPVIHLSGGEKHRVLFARALANEPEILLADEPTAGLDPYHQLHLMELFREQAERGKTVVVVLHDLILASRFCDQLVLLKEGSVLNWGTSETVLNPDSLDQGYSISTETFQHNGSRAVIPWRCRHTT